MKNPIFIKDDYGQSWNVYYISFIGKILKNHGPSYEKRIEIHTPGRNGFAFFSSLESAKEFRYKVTKHHGIEQ